MRTVNGRGIAAKYRFTDLSHGTHPPTRMTTVNPSVVKN